MIFWKSQLSQSLKALSENFNQVTIGLEDLKYITSLNIFHFVLHKISILKWSMYFVPVRLGPRNGRLIFVHWILNAPSNYELWRKSEVLCILASPICKTSFERDIRTDGFFGFLHEELHTNQNIMSSETRWSPISLQFWKTQEAH